LDGGRKPNRRGAPAAKAVVNAGDVRKALTEAKSQGKRDVLMKAKTGDANRFVAMPLGQG